MIIGYLNNIKSNLLKNHLCYFPFLVKFILTIFLYFISINIIFSQNFSEIIKQADSLFKIKEYQKANTFYKNALQIKKYGPGQMVKAAKSSAIINDYDFAFYNLNCLVDSQKNVIDTNWLKGISEFIPLQNDTRWPLILEKAKNYTKLYEKKINISLGEEISEIRKIDLYYVNMRDSIINNYDTSSAEYKIYYKDWTEAVKKNNIRLKNIIDQYGWPTKSMVGDNASMDAFFIVQHSNNIKFQKKCLRLIKKSAKKNDADWLCFSYLTDRIRIKEGKKQLYGTHYEYGEMCPVKNIKNVNKRLKKIGLPPIEKLPNEIK